MQPTHKTETARWPFAAVIKLYAENNAEFDFGQDQRDGNGAAPQALQKQIDELKLRLAPNPHASRQ